MKRASMIRAQIALAHSIGPVYTAEARALRLGDFPNAGRAHAWPKEPDQPPETIWGWLLARIKRRIEKKLLESACRRHQKAPGACWVKRFLALQALGGRSRLCA